MAGPRHGPFDAWNPNEPQLPMAGWRPGWLSIAAAAGMVLLLVAAGWVIAGRDNHAEPPGVTWVDPGAVATQFVQRYATHDPATCELVTSALRARLAAEGRCAGPVRGPAPAVAVMSSVTCGSIHTFDAVVQPEGEFGTRFVSVGLEPTHGNTAEWLVRSVLPIADCRVLAVRGCQGG